MLKVKKLHPDAKIPTLAYSGDIAYDLYALEDTIVYTGSTTAARTGLAAKQEGVGFKICDRSSLASRGLSIAGGVIDSKYTGEIKVLFRYHGAPFSSFSIYAGDKIAQMIPIPVLTGEVQEVDDLGETERGERGFGSSGS